MKPRILLSLDLSTSNTGYSTFDFDTKKLLKYGGVKPSKIKGLSKLKYPIQPLRKMEDLSEQILQVILQEDPYIIIVEEVCQGISRLGQKVLNGFHFVLLSKIPIQYLEKVRFIDVIQWRSILNIRLSEQDKLQNRQNKVFNKKAGKKGTKFTIWTAKHKAQQFVNKTFKLNFNVEKTSTDSDICDAICVGYAYLKGLI